MATEQEHRGREVELDDLLDTTSRDLARSAGEASLLVGQDGRTVLWTSARAARRLGHADATGLLAAALPAGSPGARRLAELAGTPEAASSGRLERLRFFAGFRGLLVTAQCQAVRLRDGRGALIVSLLPEAQRAPAEPPLTGGTLVGSALDGVHEATTDAMLRLDLLAKPALPALEGMQPIDPPANPPLAPRDLERIADLAEATPPDEPVESSSPTASDLGEAARGDAPADGPESAGPAWLAEPAAGRRALRFTFEADAEGRLLSLSPAFAEALGAGGLAPGQKLSEAVSAFDRQAGERIAAAMAEAATFSGLLIDWPLPGRSLAVPVELSALPRFATGRRLVGFAGFGRCRIDQAFDRPETEPVLAVAALPTEPAVETIADLPAALPADALPAGTDGISEADEGPAAVAAAEETARPEPEADEPAGAPEPAERDAEGLAEQPADEPAAIAAANFVDVSLVQSASEPTESEPIMAAEAAMAPISVEKGEAEAPEVQTAETQTPETRTPDDLTPDDPASEDQTSEVKAPEAEASKSQVTASQGTAPEAQVFEVLPAAPEPPAEEAVGLAPRGDPADDEPGPLAETRPGQGATPATDQAIAETSASEAPPPEADDKPETAGAPSLPAAALPRPSLSLVPPAGDPPGNPNVVSIRTGQPTNPLPGFQRHGLSNSERNAFREIAKALGARFDEADDSGAENSDAPGRPTALAEPAESAGAAFAARAEPVDAAGRPADAASHEAPANLLDRLPIGILVLKEDRPLFANATLIELAGYPDFFSFANEDGTRAIFRKAAMPRESRSIDTIALTTRDGELVPVEAHLQLIDWDGGKATLISMRRAVEFEQGRALRTVALELKRARGEAAELRAILDTATDGVLTLDEKGGILSLNGAAEALFGLNQNEVVGESFTRLLVNESHADALDYLDGIRAAGVKSVLNDGRDVQGRERHGGRIPLFMTLGRINDDEPRRYCAVLRDMTAWKRAEAQLTEARRAAEQASAKKSDFLAKISHEIRTPMNAIIGFAELMQEERLGALGNAKYKEYLGDIRTSGQHVVSLVNDLLDLAKIEAGRMEMNFAATDINSVVASSVGIIQPQANASRVLVRTQLAGKLPPVVADERSIRQIVLNMLSNATRYTESGGQVIVATALLETGEAVIRIRDTGIGMSPTEIEQALEPFKQVGTLRHQGGTGLGLPLTKALVEANRASFAIRSTPGEGTLVEITFPATRVLAE